MSATVLYTPAVLALAVDLARFPLTDEVPLRADARSASCGSTITLGLRCGDDGVVTAVGVHSQACAIGQASAAIFAKAVIGRGAGDITAMARAVAAWLGGQAPLPDWPGLDAIAAAQRYPARHGAVLLPWNAALQVLP